MEDYFKQHKILLGLLFIFFIVFVVQGVYSYRGLFSDGSSIYFSSLKNIIESNNNPFSLFVKPIMNLPRFFGVILLQLIYILLYPFFSGSIKANFALWQFSLFSMPFLCLILNYIAAKRTKRYDIVAFALFFYCLFSIPYEAHMTREMLVVTMVLFIFLQYFLTKVKLAFIDYFIVTLILIFMFESFEYTIFLSFVIFPVSILYSLKRKENKYFYLYCGCLFLISSFYMLYQDYKLMVSNNSFLNDFIKYNYLSESPLFYYFRYLKDSTLHSSMLVSFAGIIVLIIKGIQKSDFKRKDIIWVLPIFCISFISIYHFTKFIPIPAVEVVLFLYSVITLPLIFLFICIFDYKDITFSKSFISNIIIISCIVGMMQFSWQILSSTNSYEYAKTLKTVMQKSTKPFMVLHYTEDIKGYPFASSNNALMTKTLILSDDGNINNVFLPDYKHVDFRQDSNWEYRNIYYDKESDEIHMIHLALPCVAKLWNLTRLKEEMINLNLYDESNQSDNEFLEKLRNNDFLYEYNIDDIIKDNLPR